MILVIDNYDSFVHNLARYVRLAGYDTTVVRNDRITAEAVFQLQPEAIVISPGPCSPNEAGCSLEVVARCHLQFPILGVCLGHQVIVQSFGGQVVPSHQPMHGRQSLIEHDGSSLFANVPSKFFAGRYHSLIAQKATIPACLQATSRSDDYSIMSVQHRSLPIFGLQFHPESILTEHGDTLIGNFLAITQDHRTTSAPSQNG